MQAKSHFCRETTTSENFRIRAALTKAGMLPDDLADRVEVDVKTVERWLAGRTPHPRHRARVAQALAADELELWPESRPTNAAEDPFKELAGAWPDSGHASAPDWQAALDAATERIDLLDLTLHGILTERGVVGQLAAKVDRGTRVRILVAAAGSIYLAVNDQELGREPDPDDARSVSEHERGQAIEALQPLINQPGVEIREFVAGSPSTILRFDEQMIITLHLYGLTRAQAPVLHLRRRWDRGIFDQIQGHFDRLWEQAEPFELDQDDLPEDLEPEDEAPIEASGPPTPQQAQQALERLRAHRSV